MEGIAGIFDCWSVPLLCWCFCNYAVCYRRLDLSSAAEERGTKQGNRAAKSAVLKWLIFRRRRLIVNVTRLINRQNPNMSNSDSLQPYSPPTAIRIEVSSNKLSFWLRILLASLCAVFCLFYASLAIADVSMIRGILEGRVSRPGRSTQAFIAAEVFFFILSASCASTLAWAAFRWARARSPYPYIIMAIGILTPIIVMIVNVNFDLI